MFKSELHHLTLLYIQFNLRCLFSSTPLYYLLLPWTKQYIFLFQQRNNLGWFPRHFWREVSHDCLQRYRKDSQLHPYQDRFAVINLRCISDLLNWKIQKGEKTCSCFIHSVVSSNEHLRNKLNVVQKMAWPYHECRQELLWIMCSLDRYCYGEEKD